MWQPLGHSLTWCPRSSSSAELSPSHRYTLLSQQSCSHSPSTLAGCQQTHLPLGRIIVGLPCTHGWSPPNSGRCSHYVKRISHTVSSVIKRLEQEMPLQQDRSWGRPRPNPTRLPSGLVCEIDHPSSKSDRVSPGGAMAKCRRILAKVIKSHILLMGIQRDRQNHSDSTERLNLIQWLTTWILETELRFKIQLYHLRAKWSWTSYLTTFQYSHL